MPPGGSASPSEWSFLRRGSARGPASDGHKIPLLSFRTAPLWGVARSAPYLHDGRAATLEEAIAAHGGEASQARDAFLVLGPLERAALLAYLALL